MYNFNFTLQLSARFSQLFSLRLCMHISTGDVTWNSTTSAVPPNIDDAHTSTDVVVREGANVTLKCRANGSPPPTIRWWVKCKHEIYSKVSNNNIVKVIMLIILKTLLLVRCLVVCRKRDDNMKININRSLAVTEWENETLELTKVSRVDIAAYLCIASVSLNTHSLRTDEHEH